MPQPRPLTEREQCLFDILIARIRPPHRLTFRHGGQVLPLNDGGMGSLRFIDTNPSAAEQVSIAVAEYLTNDSDGIPVLATLYALPGGSLYEIDIRKADFSPMRHFP